ncbi:RNA polymerase sigma-70 factor, ECF subfamily [Nocardioides sp. YR527]|uniref:RNA polymerase sigma-70 factor n=1 Tax=Nocardioides sp. YR527 TaxID=1881028 RepID=UPI00089275F2|nr:RNA polymerase sigma-70 factor [Nocardioides sp. YR527]SDJ83068.1 RNA polymerase sigma-70 factor, ECF subfamily [Nocardioides sp. YR527]
MAPVDELDDALEAFNQARPRLFGVAYRILGSAAEAEDIVQEAWLRWQQHDRASVRSPAAFLTTVTTRLAINSVGSARARHETYVGPWLPEPVSTAEDPTLGAERAEALELATLLLMESLGPDQRAAYVLREAFDYSYEKIAEILSVSVVNARQLVSRAKKHIGSGRKQPVDMAEYQRLLAAFVSAARSGEVKRLEALLSEDVVSRSDGAGIVASAARRPVRGRDRVARFLAGWSDRWWPEVTLEWAQINGLPGLLMRRDGEPAAVLSISASPDGIDEIMWQMVPDKLHRAM